MQIKKKLVKCICIIWSLTYWFCSSSIAVCSKSGPNSLVSKSRAGCLISSGELKKGKHLQTKTMSAGMHSGSFNLCQLFENQVVNVSKKGWHSLKYCVNMVIICVNMVILCINKRLTICLIKTFTYTIKLIYLK